MGRFRQRTSQKWATEGQVIPLLQMQSSNLVPFPDEIPRIPDDKGRTAGTPVISNVIHKLIDV